MTVATAVIGTGYWGKNLLRNFHQLGALKAFCDSNDAARQSFSEMYPEATGYASVEEVLADPAIEAVAISTPAATHGALTQMALTAGKHVFVEKPLCLDVREAEDLGKLAEEVGRTLMVGHLLHYHPAFMALKQAVKDGVIGRLRYVQSTRASFGKIRKEENALWSFAPHDVSMMLSLAGRMPKRVTCNGEAWLTAEVADLTLSHLDFGDGVQGHIFVSWLHPYKDHRLMVIGDKGMIVFNDTVQGQEKLLHYPHSAGWEGDLPVLDKAEAAPIPYGDAEPLRTECAHFLDCVAKGTTPISNAAEGTRVLKVLDLCQKSLGEKRTIDVEGVE